MNNRKTIITVHGVGATDPGSTIRSILSEDTVAGRSAKLDRLVVDGTTYERARVAGGLEIIEVCWSDLRPKATGPLRLILEVIAVLTAMLQTAHRPGILNSNRSLVFAGLYRIVLIGGLAWCIYPPILLMFIYIYPSSTDRLLYTAGAFAAVASLSLFLRRYDPWYVCGAIVWAPGLAILGVLCSRQIVPPEQAIEFATLIYSWTQIIALLAAISATIESIYRFSMLKLTQRMVRLAFIYLPFCIASGIGALIWSLALSTVPEGSHTEFASWGRIYTANLSYPLSETEAANTLVMAACGLIFCAALLVYLVARRVNEQNSGRVAQNYVAIATYLVPLILLANSIYFAASPSFSLASVVGLSDSEIFQIYLVSSLRLVPFLPFLVGPFSVVFKVIGDVIFYVCPPTSPLSTRQSSKKRVQQLLQWRSSEIIQIVSHSQGTVVAAEAAAGFNGNLRLTTMGSPIESLYHRFLAWNLLSETGRCGHIHNVYRGDDYIGGFIPGVKENVYWGLGGHTSYWKEVLSKGGILAVGQASDPSLADSMSPASAAGSNSESTPRS